jgi:hypothetical protein
MNRRQVCSVIVAAPLAGAQTKQPSIRGRVLGARDLISWEETNAATGEITYPCGKNVVGQIIYDASGRMSGQIVNRDRSKTGSPVGGHLAWVRRLSATEAMEVLGGCISYFGRYDIDEADRVVTHHVMGDIRPSGVGDNRSRSAEFLADGRVLLAYPSGPNENRLIWERAR